MSSKQTVKKYHNIDPKKKTDTSLPNYQLKQTTNSHIIYLFK